MLGIRSTFGLPAVEKADIMPSKRVCRSLFGPVDHAQVKKRLAQEMTELDQKAMQKWNFDFKAELPITGRFTWKVVTPEEQNRVPPAYRVMLSHLDVTSRPEEVIAEPSSPVESNPPTVNSTTSTTTELDCLEPATATLPTTPEQPESRNSGSTVADTTATIISTPSTSSCLKRKRQATLTDYYVAKKSRNEDTKKSD